MAVNYRTFFCPSINLSATNFYFRLPSVEMQKIFDNAVIHTSKGDIHLKLFSRECPKTVENFCVHSKNGYYNGNIFHRVIKGFMAQTGDPTGTGCGGESIWGDEFCDEFVPTLKHDRPYTVRGCERE